ncbi:MAG: glycogen/starch synthase [Kiritimatiellae bacterium]|nr:glycogen/starch synthase [Kiritimatiellia bacterium]
MAATNGKSGSPRVLVVTPEVTALPPGMGKQADSVVAKAGGMADVTSGIVTALFDIGADVHIALPNYRRLFRVDVSKYVSRTLREYKSKLPDRRVHFAEDSLFYYRATVYTGGGADVANVALRFQREVINNILADVEPDLIHCNDWMTGLIPAAARRLDIPCLLTLHNIHTYEISLAEIEESGIDIQDFWQHLYYREMPGTYEQTRLGNKVDLLSSGIFGAHFINTVSPTFLREVVEGQHSFVPAPVREQIRAKAAAGCATGILNAPPKSYNPTTDMMIARQYRPDTHAQAKAANKQALQQELGLIRDTDAPLFFWPSRLDPMQKGCELLTHILFEVIAAYDRDGLQLAVIADGPFQVHFLEIVEQYGLRDRVALRDFDERMSHLGFAASDFTLMPSRFEPCGLPQMIGCIYGSLPIVHDTGGLHDTVTHLDTGRGTGNGFVFETYDSGGLRWAIDQAMAFFGASAASRQAHVARVMTDALRQFSHKETARQYFELYERMLARPLVDSLAGSEGTGALTDR